MAQTQTKNRSAIQAAKLAAGARTGTGGSARFLPAALADCFGRQHRQNSGKHTRHTRSNAYTKSDRGPAFIFMDGEGHPVDWEHLTDAWAAEAGYEKRYPLTDAERLEIAQVITAEAAGEPFAGKVAVAQCILQTCEDEGLRPAEVLEKYKYSRRRPEPTAEALEAVEAVFDFGHVATSEPIRYFYAPELIESSWHESQVYVMTINNHKFFKEKSR